MKISMKYKESFIRARALTKLFSSYLSALGCYMAFGFLHELMHWFAMPHSLRPTMDLQILKEMAIGRSLSLELSGDLNFSAVEKIVRHTGWISSVGFALVMYTIKSRQEKNGVSSNLSHWCTIASYLTAFDAICTDLFHLPQFIHLVSDTTNQVTFFCGNFGVILLHGCWMDETSGRTRGKSVLDILEKMIEITMMRGAQSGGVVTYSSHSQDPKSDSLQMVPARTRVVKTKRGTLSKMLRSSIESTIMKKSLFSFGNSGRVGKAEDRVQFFAGHTRFATTSKATFDGTHPHQWTCQEYSVYDMESTDQIATPRRMVVENYVTHNGDFEYFRINGKCVETSTVQAWLEVVTEEPMKTPVDSAAIAGMIDIIRSKGCFALSVRYAVCLGLPTSDISDNVIATGLPNSKDYEAMGEIFEKALYNLQSQTPVSAGLGDIASDIEMREKFVRHACILMEQNDHVLKPFSRFLQTSGEASSTPFHFAKTVVAAFFDNDLFHSVKTFLQASLGSFGLSVSSNLDSHRQVCLASRGQTISVAFYPSKNLICFGSEQAAVKCSLTVDKPLEYGHKDSTDATRDISRDVSKHPIGREALDIGDHMLQEKDVLRLDLDDVDGEICLLDWGRKKYSQPALSAPNKRINPSTMMRGSIDIFLLSESGKSQPAHLHQRLTRLNDNALITKIPADIEDPILKDITDIPRICYSIQAGWRGEDGHVMLNNNRLTAWNLANSLKQMLHRKSELPPSKKVDILLTGCEVSLWLAEQFGSDLQKAFPNLNINTISSNKLLGVFGQHEAGQIPAVGFGFEENFKDAIIIIVSHSGGTFSPLGFASIAQGSSDNIFLVASEWDTQIHKQLLQMDNGHGFKSKLFTTRVGVRAAEPCSLSVAATHQLLTSIFIHIALIILSDNLFKYVTGTVITENDLTVLERLNRENIKALEDITGATCNGDQLVESKANELRKAGDVWSEHILENAKAYVMSFVYVIGTVTAGYPLVSGIAIASGLGSDSRFLYLTRFLDALIYFFLPQINILLLRFLQGRALRHRMVGRTVVIADIPWVAQCAEAFLSKIFACSYSIAGLNVYSGNPADHLVHRMTHRVVRGSLLICGRPDGRLNSLAATESSVCLSVNQASSIQSIGSTCESITIGHNPSKLPLTAKGIFLNRHRPLFLCEKLLQERDNGKENSYSSGALLGIYKAIESELSSTSVEFHDIDIKHVIDSEIKSKTLKNKFCQLFDSLDKDKNGTLELHEFIQGMCLLSSDKSEEELENLFYLYTGSDEVLQYDEFFNLITMNRFKLDETAAVSHDEDGKVQVVASDESYFGQSLKSDSGPFLTDQLMNLSGSEKTHSIRDWKAGAMQSQSFAQYLYESRIASLQRFVAMCVMFHQMGDRVEKFFSKNTFGLLGYRKDRTHSIMRIATTASPISGAEIRDKKRELLLKQKLHRSIETISNAWIQYSMKTGRIEEDAKRLITSRRSLLVSTNSRKSLRSSTRSLSSNSVHNNMDTSSQRSFMDKILAKKMTVKEIREERQKGSTPPIEEEVKKNS